MNKLYLVIASGGRYDESWEKPMMASHDLVKLEEYIVQSKIERRLIREIKNGVNKEKERYTLENPFPKQSLSGGKSMPKWKGFGKMPESMRLERQKIQEEINLAGEEWSKKYCEWENKRKAFLCDWLKTNYPDSEKYAYLIQDYSYSSHDEWDYEIVECPMI